MKRSVLPGACLLLALILVAGCTGPGSPGHGSPAANGSVDLSKAASVDVTAVGKDWDTVPGLDGVVVYTDIKDNDRQSVLWEGPPLAADIEIWTTKAGPDMRETKDREVYSGTANISSWRDGKVLMGGGIRVPFSSMTVPAGKTTGMTIVTIHLPGGNDLTGYTGTTALVP